MSNVVSRSMKTKKIVHMKEKNLKKKEKGPNWQDLFK